MAFSSARTGPKTTAPAASPGQGWQRLPALQLGFDPAEAIVIGDKVSDIELGVRLGARTILVRTGYGVETEKLSQVHPEFVVNDLSDAAMLLAECVAPTGGTQSGTHRTEVTQ